MSKLMDLTEVRQASGLLRTAVLEQRWMIDRTTGRPVAQWVCLEPQIASAMPGSVKGEDGAFVLLPGDSEASAVDGQCCISQARTVIQTCYIGHSPSLAS